MAGNNSDVPGQTIIVVRRRKGGEEGHHGGVWKIAYADFMTAMMAFFLVMWLVNAADKKTIVQIANYFNPMKLTDRTPPAKGLEDQSEKESKSVKKTYAAKVKEIAAERKEAAEKAEAEKAEAQKSEEKKADDHKSEESKSDGHSGETKKDEEHKAEAKEKAESSHAEKKAAEAAAIMSDPQKALQEIVDAAKSRPMARGGAGKRREPFDIMAQAEQQKTKAHSSPKDALPATEPEKAMPRALEMPSESTIDKIMPSAADKHDDKVEAKDEKSGVRSDPQNVVAAPKAQDGPPAAVNAELLAKEVTKIAADVGVDGRQVEVKVVPEGLLISLIDSAATGMFEVGSIKPNAATVLLIEKIAQTIKSRKGQLVVRGHTDGRAYKKDEYGNWRLSTDRAHMTMQMLMRGGIDKERFDSVEGRSDKELRNPAKKDDPENRRVEVLLKGNAP